MKKNSGKKKNSGEVDDILSITMKVYKKTIGSDLFVTKASETIDEKYISHTPEDKSLEITENDKEILRRHGFKPEGMNKKRIDKRNGKVYFGNFYGDSWFYDYDTDTLTRRSWGF